MTEPLPNTSLPKASPEQTAAFWVQAMHDLAQPVQALALFAQRLRRLDVGQQAAPVVEHLGAGVQELQRMLQSLALVAQRDVEHLAAQAQAAPEDSRPTHLRGQAAMTTPPAAEG